MRGMSKIYQWILAPIYLESIYVNKINKYNLIKKHEI